MDKEKALEESRKLRKKAYLNDAIGLTSPTDRVILSSYPGVTTGILAIFNRAANKQLEQEFQLRDEREFDSTGTTAALRVAEDEELKGADMRFARLKGLTP